MTRSVSLSIIIVLLSVATPVSAMQYGPGFLPPVLSYVPGYGRLVHDDPFVTVYDNTGRYSPATARYRSSRRSGNTAPRFVDGRSTKRFSQERRHCAFRPDQHLPKCYVYDDCTYDELYGDGYFQQCDFTGRTDVRYHNQAEHRRIPLKVGSRHRDRNYPLYARDNYEYQNSYNHYDSYWQDDGIRQYNTYEWYDY